ncbi:MAG: hypothetical protein V1774_07940 [Candidatus Eisenbacteria bacterium]
MIGFGSLRGRLSILAVLAAATLAAGGGAAAEGELTDHLALLEQLSTEAAEEILAELQFPAGDTIHIVPETPHPSNWLLIDILKKGLLDHGYRVVVPAYGQWVDEVVTPAVPGGAGKKEGAGGKVPVPGTPPQVVATGTAQADSANVDDSDEEDPEEADSLGVGGEAAGAGGAAEMGSGEQDAAGAQTGAAAAQTGVPFSIVLPEAGEILSFRVLECGVSYPWAKRTMLIGPRRYGRMACVRLRASRIQEPGHVVNAVSSSDQVYLDSFPGWAKSMLEGQAFPFPIKEPSGTPAQAILEPVVIVGIVGGLVYLFYENQR